MRQFADVFGSEPEVEASAPGRVNLLGEHTDYNGGFVLPAAIPQRTQVFMGRSGDEWCRFYSANLDQQVRYRIGGALQVGFAAYLVGCIEVPRTLGHKITPVEILIRSDVPMGAGLASSAALEVAALRGFRTLFGLDIDDLGIARLAQQAEIRYVGAPCSLTDPMVASLGDSRHLLFLDTRNLQWRLLPLPEDSEFIVLDSGVPQGSALRGQHRRRAECEEAARRLGVESLRDIDDPAVVGGLPEPLALRARHVVTENQRVLKAASGVSAAEFGELMNASHASLREDFGVSVPALDLLVSLLQRHPSVYGAHLTGAGFGGPCVALVKAGHGAEVKAAVLDAYSAEGYRGRALV